MKDSLYVREALPQTDTGTTIQESLESNGVEYLRDGELLMLSVGITKEKARSILEKHPLSQLLNLPPPELRKLLRKPGARRFLCCMELAKRALHKGLGILPVISSPMEAIPFLTAIKDEHKEIFLCLFLNARNQVIHQEVISVGSLSASIVHPREVFQPAISHSAASVILAHNHPSGEVTPSKDDIDLTKRLAKAGEIIGIEILDHLIISSSDFSSLKERGLM